MNRHISVAYCWVSFSLWLAFPTFMTVLATIAAGIIAVAVSAIAYTPTRKLPKSTQGFAELLTTPVK